MNVGTIYTLPRDALVRSLQEGGVPSNIVSDITNFVTSDTVQARRDGNGIALGPPGLPPGSGAAISSSDPYFAAVHAAIDRALERASGLPVWAKMTIGVFAVGSLFAFAFWIAGYKFPSQRRAR